MMNQGRGQGFYLGHLWKVPVYADFGAIITMIYIFLIYNDLKMGILAILVLGLTILAHEFAHALMAIYKRMIGVTVTLSTLGGYCSYMGAENERPGTKVLISLSGPFMNFFIAFSVLFGTMIYGYLYPETIQEALREEEGILSIFFGLLMLYNFFLGILNILPLFPLDGGQALLGICRMCTTERNAKTITLYTGFITAAIAFIAYSMFLGQPGILFILIIAMMLHHSWRTLK